MKERVFRFRAVEKAIAASRPGFRVLDIGCGRGDNLQRLLRYGGHAVGLEPALSRASEASQWAPTTVAVGEKIPLASERFDMVYISHVLHHAHDVDAVLSECRRLLVPGGLLFVIETIDDSPLMRLARALQPSWDDDEVLNRFRYQDLVDAFGRAGFEVQEGAKFNWMYFAWELLPMAWKPLDFLTPIAVGLETLLHRPLGTHWGGHCWLSATRPGAPRFNRNLGAGT
ncbi:MAG: class I SAM-dependent methyltransferase [Myxococcota bacterium]|nr:class I SAM-dependent methyltransferase [Myxococcota bacterium]